MHFFDSLSRPEVLIFMIPIVAIVCGTLTKIYRMKMEARYGMSSGKGRGNLSPDDVRTLQELHKGFEKLSERVEALETILLDQARKR